MIAASTSSTNITLTTYILIVFSVALSFSGQICLRRGMVKVKETFRGAGEQDQKLTSMLKEDPWKLLATTVTTFMVLLGLFLYVASAASWLVVLADVPLGVAYPFVSLNYIVLLLYDWKIERSYKINVWNWVGVGAIVAGVMMISIGRLK